MVKQLMMNDTQLSKHFDKFRKEKIENKLKEIFGVEKVEDINEEDIGVFCEQLTRRLYLFKNSLPKSLSYVVLGVLTHEKINEKDRNVKIDKLFFFQNFFNFYFSWWRMLSLCLILT